jgi:hypothetical protein
MVRNWTLFRLGYGNDEKVNIFVSSSMTQINNLTIKDYFGDNRLNVVTGFQPDGNETLNSTTQLLVQMHAGLWSICYDLTGKFWRLNFCSNGVSVREIFWINLSSKSSVLFGRDVGSYDLNTNNVCSNDVP